MSRPRSPRTADGLRVCGKCHRPIPGSYCKPCRADWRAANADKIRGYRANRRSDPDRRWHDYLTKHGLTSAAFEELFSDQGHVCGICGTDSPGSTGWHIDHDHTCCPGGAARRCGYCVRGILCHGCNVGLGMFRDDPQRLRAALRYLGDSD